jgi:hypothetical protein
MASNAMPPGPFGYPTLLPQWGSFIIIWQIQKQPHSGGILVPHWNLSGAKIRIISETSKQFSKFNIKQRDAGPENLRPLCIEFLQNLCFLKLLPLYH